MKTIYLAADHGGFETKEKIKAYLEKKRYKIIDIGPNRFNSKDDYPDFAIPLAEKVAKNKSSVGIISCRNGQGICIAANKVKGIRAVTGFNVKEVKTTRLDDNANILSVPADYFDIKEIKRMLKAFLETPFSNEVRHKRRLQKVAAYEKKQQKT